MNSEFDIPQLIEDIPKGWVHSSPKLSNEDAQLTLIEEITPIVTKSPTLIVDGKNFNDLYHMSKKFTELESDAQTQCVQLICKCMSELLHSLTISQKEEQIKEDVLNYRNAVKMYSYLLYVITTSSEKQMISSNYGKVKRAKKHDNDFQNLWNIEKEEVLEILIEILENKRLYSLWPLQSPEEEFGAIFLKLAQLLLENPLNMKSKVVNQISIDRNIKMSIFKLILNSVNKFNLHVRASTILIDLLLKFDHTPAPIAEIIGLSYKDDVNSKLAFEILREFSQSDSQELSRDTIGSRNLSMFLSDIGIQCPRVVVANLSMLLSQLDGESYSIRNGIVQMIGQLLEIGARERKSGISDSTIKDNVREALLDVLEQREADVTAYTRSKVLQTWIQLLKSEAVPVKRLISVVYIAKRRLKDKAAHVRKSAITLCSTLLCHNPFSPNLDTKIFSEKLEELNRVLEEYEKVHSNVEIAHAKKVLSGCDENNSRMVDDEINSTKENENDDFAIRQLWPEDLDDQVGELMQQFEVKKREHIYYTACLNFSYSLSEALPLVSTLLASKTQSDCLESFEFIVLATQFKLKGFEKAAENVLHLIWSKDSAIKSAAIDALKRIYLNEGNPTNIAFRLVSLVKNCSLATLTSLSEIVKEWTHEGIFSTTIERALWNIFIEDKNEKQERNGALELLKMAATARDTIIIPRASVIANKSLKLDRDFTLARTAFSALSILKPSSLNINTIKLIKNRTYELLLCDFQSSSWFGMAEYALETIFAIIPSPVSFITEILQTKSKNIFKNIYTKKHENSQEYDDNNFISSTELSKFLFLIGHCALIMLSHLDNVESVLKKKISKEKEMIEKNKMNDYVSPKRKSNSKKKQKVSQSPKTPSRRTSKRIKSSPTASAADALDGSEEYELELLRQKCDIALTESGLLGKYIPLLTHVASHPEIFSDPTLQASALLALTKLMCTSSDLCEEKLQLLFSVMRNCEEYSVRANTIVGLGDMAFRFPSLIDSWTRHMYAPLKDHNLIVRKHSLMVLSHLILNDMIKVKGEISEIAVCTVDKDPRISGLSKLFFTELAKKSSAHVYNILPDTISRLSVNSSLSRDDFNNIMEFLLSFIEKDKQTEQLIEKLCHRFVTSTITQQWVNLACCLSQLNYSDRCAQKLIGMFNHYKDKLGNEGVNEAFSLILAKSKKSVQSNDLKNTISEYEKKISDIRNKTIEDNSADDNAMKVECS